jgi:hypothetical protein
MADGEKQQSRAGFAFTSLAFGIIALATWRWAQVGTVVAVMSVGFGIVALKSMRKLFAVIGILLGAIGLILSLTTVFLQWP